MSVAGFVLILDIGGATASFRRFCGGGKCQSPDSSMSTNSYLKSWREGKFSEVFAIDASQCHATGLCGLLDTHNLNVVEQ